MLYRKPRLLMVTYSSNENLSLCKSGFDLWKIHSAIRLHFDSKSGYDALKFNFKLPNLTYTNYEKRPDRFYYEKLFRRYPATKDITMFFLANILELNGKTWVGHMTDEPLSRLAARFESFSYRFKADVRLLAQASCYRLDDLLHHSTVLQNDSENNLRGAPSRLLYILAYDRSIMIETVAIIDQLVGFLESYKKFITPAADPLGLWSEEIYKIRQYGSFLPGKIDLARAKDTLIKEFTFSPD